jgi:hypothetical protein
MGTTSDFGPSVALVAPWMVNGTLTSFLDQNDEILTLLDRLLLVRTQNTFCALELILWCPSSMALPLASITVSNRTHVDKKMNNFCISSYVHPD